MRCAVLDDYQSVALTMADWSSLGRDVAVEAFAAPLGDAAAVIEALQGFDVVAMMRERTPFPRRVIEGLPALKLLITTGMHNRSIDLAACAERGVTVCGTGSFGNPTTGITFGLMLELTRRIGYENARMKAGQPWQTTIGEDLEGKTLGLLGLGKLGLRVAAIGAAFGMKVAAWSQNLTAERCREAGVAYLEKDDLFRSSDIVSVHLQLSERTRALVTRHELGLMKPTAFLINTSRGPIVEEAALVAALTERRIAGAGLDVFDVEPLPLAHPLRRLDNVVLTPHLGYVSRQNYERYYPDIVEDIRCWRDGKPVRVIAAK